MLFAQAAEDEKSDRPDTNEEDEEKDEDAPGRGVLRGPKVPPVPTIGGGEPVVLEDDGDEEPDDDFAAEEGIVEGGDFAGFLAVVVGKAEEDNECDGPEEDGDGGSNTCDLRAGRQEGGGRNTGIGGRG